MSLLTEPFDAFVQTRRRDGWWTAIKLLAVPFCEFHRAVITRRPLNTSVDLPPLDSAVVIRPATLDDLALFNTIVPALRVKRFANRIKSGETCLIAVENNRVIAYVWVAAADSPSTKEVQLKLGAREVYSWGAYVEPEFRSRGIMRALLARRNNWLREQGYETLYGWVERTNIRMLKPTGKTGEVAVGNMTFIRVLKWTVTRITPYVAA